MAHVVCMSQRDSRKMSNTDQLGLKDLLALTGAKTRTLQFWSDHGVLQASAATDKQGRGAHRRYAKSEAIIALIAAELDNFKIPVGEMLRISTRLRDSLELYIAASRTTDADSLTYIIGDKIAADVVRRGWCLNQAIYGNGEYYLFIMLHPQMGYIVTAFSASHSDQKEFDDILLGDIAVMRTAKASPGNMLRSLPEGVSSALLVRLDKVLKPYRDKLLSRIAL